VRWFEKAVEKGSLKNTGTAHLLLGIAYYNGRKDDHAREAFVRARKHDSSRAEAERWIAHMATEAAEAG
jgi:TPR repeat protein